MVLTSGGCHLLRTLGGFNRNRVQTVPVLNHNIQWRVAVGTGVIGLPGRLQRINQREGLLNSLSTLGVRTDKSLGFARYLSPAKKGIGNKYIKS